MILETIHDPNDIKSLNDAQTQLLCTELREFLLKNVSVTGGHLASNLGAVELTVAKRGFGYKQHGRRPCVPPRVDLRGVQERLSVHLPPSITIRSVADAGTSIIITMVEKNDHI